MHASPATCTSSLLQLLLLLCISLVIQGPIPAPPTPPPPFAEGAVCVAGYTPEYGYAAWPAGPAWQTVHQWPYLAQVLMLPPPPPPNTPALMRLALTILHSLSSLSPSLTHSLTHSLTPSLVSLTQPVTRSLAHSLTYSLWSPTHSRMHARTHSLTHSLTLLPLTSLVLRLCKTKFHKMVPACSGLHARCEHHHCRLFDCSCATCKTDMHVFVCIQPLHPVFTHVMAGHTQHPSPPLPPFRTHLPSTRPTRLSPHPSPNQQPLLHSNTLH